MDFSDLVELYYADEDSAYEDAKSYRFQAIIKKASNSNLRKLEWHFGNNHGVQEIVAIIMRQCEEMHYLHLGLSDMRHGEPAIIPMLHTIEKALAKTNQIKRKSFKLKIETDVDGLADKNECMLTLGRVARLLKRGTEDFMIILHLIRNTVRMEMFNHIVGDFCVYQWEDEKGDECFIITNKDCKICGYREKWMMDCPLVGI